MLTHDEIILSAFQKGYNVREIKNRGASEEFKKMTQKKYELYKNNCIVGRLYPHEEAQNRLSIQENTPTDFYNLYVELNSHG